MDEEYQIDYIENPEESAWGIIGRGVGSYNKQQAGDNDFQRLCYVLHETDQDIVGGVLGATYWEWFYVDLIWVKDDLRGQGYGKQLMEIAEAEARRRGAKYAYLDTFSFQAPGFYEGIGYEIFGELGDYPPGHRRYFMKKKL